jgi:cysteinyl-tRNA synthetase
MDLILFNTRTRRPEPFAPQWPDRVTMYLCGPTVYNYVHIGNARGPVVFDVLASLLRRRYPKLVYARNITDVDDKINKAAQDLGVPIATITDRYTAIYRDDMARLGVAPQDVEPHATAHIPQMVAMIETLIADGHAYAAEGHVLFSIASYADYGRLSGRPMDEMIAGARVDVAPYKRDPGDFVLWKPSPPGLPGWDSPWGVGRPGWHIECSAMAAAHLGETIDIHAGGNDLLFPHHENEVAQSTCAHGGKVFARYWLHNGMLDFGGAKMSKSLGNVSVLHELIARYPPEALRFALLTAQYRQPLDWSDALIEQSIRTLDRLYGTLRDLADAAAIDAGIPPSIDAALCDDLNTPAALAEIARIAGEARKATDKGERARLKGELLGAGLALGLLQQDHVEWFQRPVHATASIELGAATLSAAGNVTAHVGLSNEQIDDLMEERNEARKAKDFARSDAIRDRLAAEGIVLEDTAQGVRWVRRRA